MKFTIRSLTCQAGRGGLTIPFFRNPAKLLIAGSNHVFAQVAILAVVCFYHEVHEGLEVFFYFIIFMTFMVIITHLLQITYTLNMVLGGARGEEIWQSHFYITGLFPR